MAPGLSHTLFLLSAFAAVVCALLVVTRRNPIYSALYLILFFATMALEFLLLDAVFLAFMQVLVYGGAIMVLYIFVVMLINPREGDLPDEGGVADRGIAFGVAFGLFVLMTAAIARSERVTNTGSIPALAPVPATVVMRHDNTEDALAHGSIELFGMELFSRHLLVFELASILITIAIVGAVHLSLRQKTSQPPAQIPSGGVVPVSSPNVRPEEPAHV